jgi:hypothetical protein
MTNGLLLAILSMDTYNRGSDPALRVDATAAQFLETWIVQRPKSQQGSHTRFQFLRTARAVSRLALWLALFPFMSFVSADDGLSDEACEHPEYFTSRAIPPAYHLGEFQIPLISPDLSNRAAVQRHLAFSIVFSDLLKSELQNQTGDACNAVISASRFPDLRVILYLSESSQPNEANRSRCSSVLRDILHNLRPTETSVSESASSKAQWRSLIASSPSAISEVLPIVLTYIYDVDTVMHALISIDQKTFQSIEPSRFLEWLQTQRSAVGSIGLVPIRTDCEPKANGLVPGGDTPAKRVPYSAAIAAGAVQITLRMDPPRSDGPLRHMVVASNDRAVPNAPIVSPATEKYCNRERDFAIDPSSATTTTVRIRCWTQDFYETDAWTVFYCEPRDCVSERTAKAVTMAIAGDPDVLAFAKRDSEPRQSMGPYLVNIEVAGK